MIEFLTLLLGIVTGQPRVELAVSPEVAAVELRLDGEVAGRRDEAPWAFTLDLGATLAPHELVAVAYGAAGEEVGRTTQRFNLPQERVEARLVVEPDDEGWPAALRLAWASLDVTPPESVEVSLDGQVIAAAGPNLWRLPGYDRHELHFVSAALEFADGGTATVDACFGGRFGEQVSIELTAVPLVASGRQAQRRLRRSGDLLLSGGDPLEVVLVESPAADVVFVLERAAHQALREAIEAVERRVRRNTYGPASDLLPLGRQTRLHFVWPVATEHLGVRNPVLDPGLFVAAAPAPGDPAGPHWALGRTAAGPLPQRVADAVLVAGLAAAGGNHPRAVVLVADPGAPDRSDTPPSEVRRYLARLHVPFFVWTTAAEPRSLRPTWGEVTSVSKWSDLRRAVHRVREALDAQVMVWVKGIHLPQRIRVCDSCNDVWIAGTE